VPSRLLQGESQPFLPIEAEQRSVYLQYSPEHVQSDVYAPRTSVADMPGYPTRKLLFGFPDTLTLADAICSQILSPHWALQPSLNASPAGITRRWKGVWYVAEAGVGTLHLACFGCDDLCSSDRMIRFRCGLYAAA
jgi:hypothetical protein